LALTITAIVCAYNEASYLPACLFSLLAQTRPPDEILVINNASTDRTAAVAQAVPGVTVIDEPTKGLVSYEPFLLCDFHVHTRWSDGRLTIREVIDLYGQTKHFDVIAITDHILMKRDLLARAGRMASLGYRQFSVTEDRFDAYLGEIEAEGKRAKRLYDLLVIPGAEVTQNHIRSKENSHIIGLNLRKFISADQPAEDILKAIRRQGALSVACHPHHRTTRRVEIGTCYLWDHRKSLVELVDVWEAANRDDLFSVTSLKHYPYVANSDFHKPKHLYSWKTLVRCEKDWEAIAHALRANVDIALTLYRNGAWAA
jgi:predicted metal-dependent phosphoesterase TrpH